MKVAVLLTALGVLFLASRGKLDKLATAYVHGKG